MLVLFDHGTPRTLARHLIDHHMVTEARARGWERVENGELLTLEEAAGFEVLVTTDQNLTSAEPYEPPNCDCCFGKRPVRINLGAPSADRRSSERSHPGSFAEVEIPYE